MDIKEAKDQKKIAENDIKQFINERIRKFADDTGISPWSLDVMLLDETTTASGERICQVSGVDLDVSL